MPALVQSKIGPAYIPHGSGSIFRNKGEAVDVLGVRIEKSQRSLEALALRS